MSREGNKFRRTCRKIIQGTLSTHLRRNGRRRRLGHKAGRHINIRSRRESRARREQEVRRSRQMVRSNRRKGRSGRRRTMTTTSNDVAAGEECRRSREAPCGDWKEIL